jgi:hypothetical protein
MPKRVCEHLRNDARVRWSNGLVPLELSLKRLRVQSNGGQFLAQSVVQFQAQTPLFTFADVKYVSGRQAISP